MAPDKNGMLGGLKQLLLSLVGLVLLGFAVAGFVWFNLDGPSAVALIALSLMFLFLGIIGREPSAVHLKDSGIEFRVAEVERELSMLIPMAFVLFCATFRRDRSLYEDRAYLFKLIEKLIQKRKDAGEDEWLTKVVVTPNGSNNHLTCKTQFGHDIVMIMQLDPPTRDSSPRGPGPWPPPLQALVHAGHVVVVIHQEGWILLYGIQAHELVESEVSVATLHDALDTGRTYLTGELP